MSQNEHRLNQSSPAHEGPSADERLQPDPSARAEATQPGPEPEKQKLNMTEMAITFVSPALFGKLMILYFGSKFSSHPGQGYGIGLSFAIAFTLVMIGRFLWKYKDYAEEE